MSQAHLQVILLTALAGAAIPLGGVLGRLEGLLPGWLESEVRHTVIAFGGGVLLAAVALVLVPEGATELALVPTMMAFGLGGLAFCLLDAVLARRDTPASQLVAMLSDFVPEAMALGAAFGTGGATGLLLAILIALQNLPEGFSAYREMTASGKLSQNAVLGAFVGLVPLGPLAGLAGLAWLPARPRLLGWIMLFAAGGILFITFREIAPQARLERHWWPSMGAVAGFLLGLVSSILAG